MSGERALDTLPKIAAHAAAIGCRKVAADLLSLHGIPRAVAAKWLRAKLATVQDHTIPRLASSSERLYKEALRVVER